MGFLNGKLFLSKELIWWTKIKNVDKHQPKQRNNATWLRINEKFRTYLLERIVFHSRFIIHLSSI